MPSAPNPRPESRPATIAPLRPSRRTSSEPPAISTTEPISSHQCTGHAAWCGPSGPAATASSTSAPQSTPIDVHSSRFSRSPSIRTLSSAVITRLALMIVCDRNSGSSRAASAPSRKPTKSSTVPRMNSQVTTALAVEARLGPPCSVVVASGPAPPAGAAPARAASSRADRRAPRAWRTEPVP
ncbi:hypothetical protein [Kitasatospora paranensis]|uniref:hypothetical protein n=1 Tax=Kitasatospora paranensis TaxID=258053 RepID=UPI003CD07FA3